MSQTGHSFPPAGSGHFSPSSRGPPRAEQRHTISHGYGTATSLSAVRRCASASSSWEFAGGTEMSNVRHAGTDEDLIDTCRLDAL